MTSVIGPDSRASVIGPKGRAPVIGPKVMFRAEVPILSDRQTFLAGHVQPLPRGAARGPGRPPGGAGPEAEQL